MEVQSGMIRIRDEPLDGVADSVHLNGHERGEAWPPLLAVADLRIRHDLGPIR
jgi:hypothetical protein